MRTLRNRKFALCLATLGLAGFSSACGKQAYTVAQSSLEAEAPGFYFIPPKVDILLAEDDTGSKFEVFDRLSSQMPLLLERLNSKGWDYHFATTPLTTRAPIMQVAAARYDIGWGADWTLPFPGATPDLPGMVTSWAFRRPENYTEFVSLSGVSNSANALEPGFSTINHALGTRLTPTNFLRNDAMLVILAVSNGEDTSGVTMCDRNDRIIGNGNDELIAPCEDVGYPSYGTKSSSFTNYRNALLAHKGGSANAVRFYSIVSPTQTSNCYGQPARAGSRYMQMASALGGTSYNLCNTPLESALSGLESQLSIERRSFRTRYLFIEQDAEVSTIKVIKYSASNPSGTEIPQSATNGWTYSGLVQNVYAIDQPIPMNLVRSGYAIELHGSAKLVGDERADITYKPAGAVDAAAR